jgi:hypothetical protein
MGLLREDGGDAGDDGEVEKSRQLHVDFVALMLLLSLDDAVARVLRLKRKGFTQFITSVSMIPDRSEERPK